jgi:hypothetical protein
MLITAAGRHLLGPALATALLAWPIAGQGGRFLDCQEIQRDGSDQIVVGDIGLAPGADAAAAELARQRLQNQLRQQLADLAASSGGVLPVMCPGHAPSRADYTEPIVDRRYGYGVLVELWGVASGPEAKTTYVLLPLMLAPYHSQTITGFYSLIYWLDPQGGIAGLFAEPRELRAFTALGAGLHALAAAERSRDRKIFGRAYATLCKATTLLAEAGRHAGPDGPSTAEWAALQTLAKDRARAAAQAGSTAVGRPPTGVNIGECDVPPPDPPLPPIASLVTGAPR